MSHSPLRYLHSFLIVANEGSFVRAADRLAVSQPALSYQMRQLEQWLGVPLFERAGRKLVLTRAGASVRAWCRDAFAGLDELRAALHSGEMERVSLKLASGSSFGRHVLMPALLDPAPESDAPLLDDVRLELAFGSDDEVFAHVESGRADLGFVYTPRTSRLFEHHAVYTEEFVLACGAARCANARLRARWPTARRCPSSPTTNPMRCTACGFGRCSGACRRPPSARTTSRNWRRSPHWWRPAWAGRCCRCMRFATRWRAPGCRWCGRYRRGAASTPCSPCGAPRAFPARRRIACWCDWRS